MITQAASAAGCCESDHPLEDKVKASIILTCNFDIKLRFLRRSNPESNVALMTLADLAVLVTLTTDTGKILAKLHQVSIDLFSSSRQLIKPGGAHW